MVDIAVVSCSISEICPRSTFSRTATSALRPPPVGSTLDRHSIPSPTSLGPVFRSCVGRSLAAMLVDGGYAAVHEVGQALPIAILHAGGDPLRLRGDQLCRDVEHDNRNVHAFRRQFPLSRCGDRYIASSALRLQWEFMKARVYVSMKPSVLDPQGQTIRSALAGLGHTSIAAVRQGKYFEITLEPGTDRTKASAEIEQIARDVLANPVIEEYRVEFVE